MDHQQREIIALRELARRLTAELAQKDREIARLVAERDRARGQLWGRAQLAGIGRRSVSADVDEALGIVVAHHVHG